MPRGGIPDRWLSYSKVGKIIVGTPFIAFKVPLKEQLSLNVEPQERFSPSSLMEQYPNLGLVIDLTFTSRYYGPAEFLARGVKHCKILCPGHGSAPSDKEIQRFTEVVDSFLEERPSEEKLVGVHCTHGLNRTGFMICRYMIDRMGFSPDRAVKAFDEARGHPIERTEYLECLGCTDLSGRPPTIEKSDRRSRHKKPGGIQEQCHSDSQPLKASWNQDRNIPGKSRESERLGDPYKYSSTGSSGNADSYQQDSYRYDSRSGNASRDSYQRGPYQHDSRSGIVQRDSYQQYDSHSSNAKRDSYQHYDSRSGSAQRDSYQHYDSRSGSAQRDSYPKQTASGYYQDHNSDGHFERYQGGQRHQAYRRPFYNRGVNYGQDSRSNRMNSTERNEQGSRSKQEEDTYANASCWF